MARTRHMGGLADPTKPVHKVEFLRGGGVTVTTKGPRTGGPSVVVITDTFSSYELAKRVLKL